MRVFSLIPFKHLSTHLLRAICCFASSRHLDWFKIDVCDLDHRELYHLAATYFSLGSNPTLAFLRRVCMFLLRLCGVSLRLPPVV